MLDVHYGCAQALAQKGEFGGHLWYDLDTQRLRSPHNSPRDRFEGQMSHVFVRLLDLRNLVNVLHAELSNNLVTRFSSSLCNSGTFLEKVARWRRFRHERECSVWTDGDDSWRRCTRLDMCCSCVEFFAEIHRLYSFGSESWTYGR